MKDSTKTILIVILFIAAYFGWKSYKFGGTSYDSTYICKSDKNISIEFVNNEEIKDAGINLVYLHIGDDIYEGFYLVIKKGIFKRTILITFNNYNITEDNPEGSMSECFIITRNKMKVASGDSLYYYSQNSIFEDGQKFYRKTWWNTWGRKVVFILCIIGFIMAFSDDIIRLVTGNKNYESKNEIIKNIREDVRDPMVRDIKEAVEEFKESMTNQSDKDDTQKNQDIFEQNKSGTEAQYVGQQNPASTDNNDVKEEAGNRKAELETEGSKETLKSSHGTKETFNIQKQIHMAACKSCGKSIDMNAKFCKYCGAKKEVRNESDMKVDIFTCPNCGKTIARNVNFCHYCGEKIMSEIH